MNANHANDALVQRAIAGFRDHFDTDPTLGGVAPGRVNLIGEHTDYNDGFVMPLAIERRTVVVGVPNHSPRCRMVALDHDGNMATFMLEGIAPGTTEWVKYPKGVIAQFIDNGHPVPGFDAVVTSDVPLGSGLSSSAALEVATASMIEQLLGIRIDPVHKALWAQKAEHDYANMPCGIMDQFISAMGQRDHALLIDCRDHSTRLVKLVDPDVAVLITNSGVKHNLGDTEYPLRRQQCEEAAATIAKTYPQVKALRDADMKMLAAAKEDLDEVVYRRARHVIGENERTVLAADALDRGDYPEVGRLMYESHAFLRDDYEVSCPELDVLVELARGCDGVFGSRMTGGGFGGCTVTLVKAANLNATVEAIQAGYAEKTGKEAVCFSTRPADGAQSFTLA